MAMEGGQDKATPEESFEIDNRVSIKNVSTLPSLGSNLMYDGGDNDSIKEVFRKATGVYWSQAALFTSRWLKRSEKFRR